MLVTDCHEQGSTKALEHLGTDSKGLSEVKEGRHLEESCWQAQDVGYWWLEQTGIN